MGGKLILHIEANMNMRNFLEKTFTIKDILISIFPWLIIVFQSYYLNQMQQDLNNLKIYLKEERTHVFSLKDEIALLNGKVDSLSASFSVNSTVDPLLVVAQNDMLQFYFKVTGVCAGVFVIYIITSSIWPALFSVKKLLPLSVYNFIQSYTPFLQTKSSYSFRESSLKFDWLVNIYNDKNLEILIKPFNSSDYLKAADYILTLQKKTETVVLTQNTMFTEYTAEQTALVLANIANSVL